MRIDSLGKGNRAPVIATDEFRVLREGSSDNAARSAECIFMTEDVMAVHVAELCLMPYVTKGKSIIIATPTDTPVSR